MRILLIHGRAQGGLDPDSVKKSWEETLIRGLTRAGITMPSDVTCDFPYYGDHLDGLVAKLANRATIEAKGEAEDAVDHFLAETLVGLADADITLAQEAKAELEPGEPLEKGPQNWAWVRAIARAVDRHFGWAEAGAIAHFLRDVHLYISSSSAQREIDAIVDEKVTREPTLVVGHSLGSVVSYQLLRRRTDLNLKGHITLGSPLGIRAIARTLGVPQNPAVGTFWYNAFDPRDIVALRPLDENHFSTDPAIHNDPTVDNQTSNRHGIVGYLDHPQVAQHIAKAFR